jgi:hypothetical protein
VRRAIRLLILGTVLAACAGGARSSVPFDISAEVEETLAGWQQAGITCEGPEVGMPGPAAEWPCRGRLDDVDVKVRLIADTYGLQSIHAGVASTIDLAAAARVR